MEKPQPVIVLVETQMGENIGMCARAMLNCGLNQLRLVAPRDGWPNDRAVATAADADEVIEQIACFDTVRDAVADCTRVFATTARNRSRQIPALEVEKAVGEINASPGRCAILFGPEASGLDNESLSFADTLLDLPVNPEFSSLNLGQAVLLFGWEWWRGKTEVERTVEPPATKEGLNSFMDRLESQLEAGQFFPSPDLRPETVRNLRTLFGRIAPTERELRMLHGVVTALGVAGRDK
ncbi:MAG: RNA methyltransferase [Verrucomicrobiales bacterium]|nr:RNA methyltransferase [Verrucomicrobiales bacterium]